MNFKSVSVVPALLALGLFVAAPAFRTWCVAHGVSGFSVDYALPGRGRSIPTVPVVPLKRMRYSHFACNVVHEDIAYPIDHDVDAIKHALKKSLMLLGQALPLMLIL